MSSGQAPGPSYPPEVEPNLAGLYVPPPGDEGWHSLPQAHVNLGSGSVVVGGTFEVTKPTIIKGAKSIEMQAVHVEGPSTFHVGGFVKTGKVEPYEPPVWQPEGKYTLHGFGTVVQVRARVERAVCYGGDLFFLPVIAGKSESMPVPAVPGTAVLPWATKQEPQTAAGLWWAAKVPPAPDEPAPDVRVWRIPWFEPMEGIVIGRTWLCEGETVDGAGYSNTRRWRTRRKIPVHQVALHPDYGKAIVCKVLGCDL